MYLGGARVYVCESESGETHIRALHKSTVLSCFSAVCCDDRHRIHFSGHVNRMWKRFCFSHLPISWIYTCCVVRVKPFECISCKPIMTKHFIDIEYIPEWPNRTHPHALSIFLLPSSATRVAGAYTFLRLMWSTYRQTLLALKTSFRLQNRKSPFYWPILSTFREGFPQRQFQCGEAQIKLPVAMCQTRATTERPTESLSHFVFCGKIRRRILCWLRWMLRFTANLSFCATFIHKVFDCGNANRIRSYWPCQSNINTKMINDWRLHETIRRIYTLGRLELGADKLRSDRPTTQSQ